MRQCGDVLLRAVLCALFVSCETQAADDASRGTDGYRFKVHERWERPRTVVGVRYNMGDCAGMPLGGLGTGTISINSFGEFERNGLMNNPRPQGKAGGCFFVVRSESPEGITTRILQGREAHGLKPVKGLKFLGHFPIAEIDYEDDFPVEISLRAMTPFIYRDSKNSGLPVAMFTLRVRNKLEDPNRVSIAFSWRKPSPDIMADVPVTCRGNVGAIGAWRRKRLTPGETASIWVFQSLGESAENLNAELQKVAKEVPRFRNGALDTNQKDKEAKGIVLSNGEVEFALDPDGCFNWENWGKETFTWKKLPTVGQHYFAVHYDDGQERVAGVAYRPSAPNELRNLVVETPSYRIGDRSAVTRLSSSDGALGVSIFTILTSRTAARRFQITNRGNTELRNVELRYFVNYDVGGPGHEADDAGGYTLGPWGAAVLDEVSRIVCLLTGSPPPSGIFVGEWAQARERLFKDSLGTPEELRRMISVPPPWRTRDLDDQRLFGLWSGTHVGEPGEYAIGILRQDGVQCDNLEEWWSREEDQAAPNPWREFEEKGTWASLRLAAQKPQMPGVRVSRWARGPAMAVSASVILEPEEERELRFLLTWFFPDQKDSDRTSDVQLYARRFFPDQEDSEDNFIGHMYSNWFGGSGDVAEYVARRWSALNDGTAAWQEAIYESSLPDWLKDGLVNSLYSLARNTLWIKDGRFAHSESFVGCPITETMVCRFYGSIPTAMFFPDLERNTMFQFARHQRSDGAIPFAFGQPEFFDKPYYETQKSLDSSEFVLMACRDYRWWNDESFLREIYPHVKKATEYARTLDTDGDGVINEVSMQYYDIWQFKGTSAYVGTIWLAALRAAEEMAKVMGDTSFADECRELFARASRSFDEKLWNGRYYRLYNDPATGEISETCLGNQLVGQWFAYSAGLGEILPKEKILSSLKAVEKLNAATSPYGLVNGVRPDGTPDTSGKYHSSSITIGETFCYAATCVYAGGPKTGMDMAKALYENIALRLGTPWNTTWNIDAKTGELGWGPEYYSNMCLWDLYGALTGKRGLIARESAAR
jgi:uncharacterized protein (DUF608 family)